MQQEQRKQFSIDSSTFLFYWLIDKDEITMVEFPKMCTRNKCNVQKSKFKKDHNTRGQKGIQITST